MDLRNQRPTRWQWAIPASPVVLIVVFYAVIVTYNYAEPARALSDEEITHASLLEQCRQYCVTQGLVPTGNLAEDARTYLRSAKPAAFPQPLAELLADQNFIPAATERHDLLEQAAPDFRLADDAGRIVSLSQQLERGPVVVVFYYGYWCSHCVAQLFGLNEDIQSFRALGAQVIAISADPPEQTAERFAQYGRFDFPVLSDIDNRVAEQYDVFTPADEEDSADQRHGTFLIGEDGRVLWCQTGYQPFLDNQSLLHLISTERDRSVGSKR
jgi:peroxiredoxin